MGLGVGGQCGERCVGLGGLGVNGAMCGAGEDMGQKVGQGELWGDVWGWELVGQNVGQEELWGWRWDFYMQMICK